jgi:hypothetical protein
MPRLQLMAKISQGDVLSVMGVPPGSGIRMGVDRDLDGLRDGDDPTGLRPAGAHNR